MPRIDPSQRIVAHIKTFLHKFSMEDGPWAVGYSGGRDSTVLLWTLIEAVGTSKVTAVHVDHRWRPEDERTRERAMVEQFCAARKIALASLSVPEVPRNEAHARHLRYELWDEWTRSRPQRAFFLAHHQDDQAETILMRLLKGRAWTGLSGIPPIRGVYVRPFLTVSRQFLALVADEQRLPYHEDSSNSSAGPLRNFLRNQIFPLLDTRIPRSREALVRLGSYWRDHVRVPSLRPEWEFRRGRFRLDVERWLEWTPAERNDQLEVTAHTLRVRAPTRRFLETLARAEVLRTVRTGVWAWEVRGTEITWGPDRRSRRVEFCSVIDRATWSSCGPWVIRWESIDRGGSTFSVNGLNPESPLVVRSRGNGGELRLSQDGGVIGTWKSEQNRWFASGSEPPKLHKDQFFVTLVKRSDYERR